MRLVETHTPPTPYSGDVIVRVNPLATEADWLAAKLALDGALSDFPPPPQVERLIRNTSFAAMANLEGAAWGNGVPVSLNQYLRIWLRDRPWQALDVITAVKGLPEVEDAWMELRASGPSVADAEWHLRTRDGGSDLPYVQGLPSGLGGRCPLYVVERGVRVGHPDLKGIQLNPLVGDNGGDSQHPDDLTIQLANHGLGTFALAAGHTAAGILGTAPESRVRFASCYCENPRSSEHVADALVAIPARTHRRRRGVVLLETQRGPGMPTECEEPDFHAIRLLTRLGYQVVEPAGNGATDLSTLAGSWFYQRGAPYVDSGAVLVSAVRRSGQLAGFSNYGGPVTCAGEGVNIVTAGAARGSLILATSDLDGVRRADMDGTSPAAAIVAGILTAMLSVSGPANRGPKPAAVRTWIAQHQTPEGRIDLPAFSAGVWPTAKHPPLPAHLPPLPPAVFALPSAWAVSSPQASDGNLGVHATSSSASTEYLSCWVTGSGLQAGHAVPSSNTTVTENWVFQDKPGWKNDDVAYWIFRGGTSPDRTNYQGCLLTYQALPANLPSPPSGSGDIRFHLAKYGGSVVAEMYRQENTGSGPREWWVFLPTFVFPDANHILEVARQPNNRPDTEVINWFGAWKSKNTGERFTTVQLP